MGEAGLAATHAHEPLLVCTECTGYVCGLCGTCTECGRTRPKDGGVLRLLPESHPFYEGAYQTQTHFSEAALKTLRGRVLLPFVTYGYLKAIVKHVPRGAKLLELGCGGGMQLAATRYEVTAVDLSLVSLRGTPAGYRHRIQADVMRLDFRFGTFDAIAASCFWEHFTPDEKETLLDKFAQWLKPGGVLILFFDTASENPCFRWFRRFPELYQRCFVDHDGHVGLETVSANHARFARHGMRLVRGVGLNRTLQHLPVYVWMAPYAGLSLWAWTGAKVAAWLYEHPMLSQAFTGGLHVWDLTLGRAFPLNWSRLFLGVWRKT